MAGSPPKRQRKAGIRTDDGSVIAFPYLPRVADLPRGSRNWSQAQKIEHLLGMSLHRAAEILTWPVAELDPLRASPRMQVWRVVFMIGAKAWLNGTLGREADRDRTRRSGSAVVRSHQSGLTRNVRQKLALASFGKDRVARGGAQFYRTRPQKLRAIFGIGCSRRPSRRTRFDRSSQEQSTFMKPAA